MIRRLFGVDEGWERPVDVRAVLPRDAAAGLVLAVLAIVSLETSRSLGAITEDRLGPGGTWVWVALPSLALAARRIAPLAVASLALVHYLVTATLVPEVAPVFALQIFYFLALFSAVAWARNRWAADAP